MNLLQPGFSTDVCCISECNKEFQAGKVKHWPQKPLRRWVTDANMIQAAPKATQESKGELKEQHEGETSFHVMPVQTHAVIL